MLSTEDRLLLVHVERIVDELFRSAVRLVSRRAGIDFVGENVLQQLIVMMLMHVLRGQVTVHAVMGARLEADLLV